MRKVGKHFGRWDRKILENFQREINGNLANSKSLKNHKHRFSLISHWKFSRIFRSHRPKCFPTFFIDKIFFNFRVFSYALDISKSPGNALRALFWRPWALLRGRGHFPLPQRYNINIARRILATGPYGKSPEIKLLMSIFPVLLCKWFAL